jgi:hypothetical protein
MEVHIGALEALWRIFHFLVHKQNRPVSVLGIGVE